PMRPDERALIKSMIMRTYSQFVSDVSKGRKMPASKVRSLADGRVYTGTEAKKLGLVDEIGGLRETVLAAGRAGRIKGEPKVKEYGQGGLAGALFGSEDEEMSGRPLGDAVMLRFVRSLLGSEQSYQGLR
ncbi:MAG TPA: S49 family peptidase, partial [Chloroflexota bacterium]|nr:S49 family peptidase [Chloroflexota bacterium]